MFDEFDFSPGKITFNNYDISPNEDLNEDNLNLTEDMLQVAYDKNIVLDVGWYLGMNCFIVYIIKGHNWENPLLKIKAESYDELNSSLIKAVEYIRNKLLD